MLSDPAMIFKILRETQFIKQEIRLMLRNSSIIDFRNNILDAICQDIHEKSQEETCQKHIHFSSLSDSMHFR